MAESLSSNQESFPAILVVETGQVVDATNINKDIKDLSPDKRAMYLAVLGIQTLTEIKTMDHFKKDSQSKKLAETLEILGQQSWLEYDVPAVEIPENTSVKDGRKLFQQAVFKKIIMDFKEIDEKGLSKGLVEKLIEMYKNAGGDETELDLDLGNDFGMEVSDFQDGEKLATVHNEFDKQSADQEMDPTARINTLTALSQTFLKHLIGEGEITNDRLDQVTKQLSETDAVNPLLKDIVLEWIGVKKETLSSNKDSKDIYAEKMRKLETSGDQSDKNEILIRDYFHEISPEKSYEDEKERKKKIAEIATNIEDKLQAALTASTVNQPPSPKGSQPTLNQSPKNGNSGVSRTEISFAAGKGLIRKNGEEDVSDEVAYSRAKDLARFMRSETMGQQEQGFFKRTIRNIWQNSLFKNLYDTHAEAEALTATQLVMMETGALLDADTWLTAQTEARERLKEKKVNVISRFRGMFSLKNDRLAQETLSVLKEWSEDGNEKLNLDIIRTNAAMDTMAEAVAGGAINERLGEISASVDLDDVQKEKLIDKLNPIARRYLIAKTGDDLKVDIELRKELNKWLSDRDGFRAMLTTEQKQAFASSSSFGTDLFKFFDEIGENIAPQLSASLSHGQATNDLDLEIEKAFSNIKTIKIGTKEFNTREVNEGEAPNWVSRLTGSERRRRKVNEQLKDWSNQEGWMNDTGRQVLNGVSALWKTELGLAATWGVTVKFGMTKLAHLSIAGMPVVSGLKAGKRTENLYRQFEFNSAMNRDYVGSGKRHEKFKIASVDKRNMTEASQQIQALMYEYDENGLLQKDENGKPREKSITSAEEAVHLAVLLADADARSDLEFEEKQYLWQAGDAPHKDYQQERMEIDILRIRARQYLQKTLQGNETLQKDFLAQFAGDPHASKNVDQALHSLTMAFKINMRDGKNPVGPYEKLVSEVVRKDPKLADQIFTGHLEISEDDKTGSWLRRKVLDERTKNRSLRSRSKALRGLRSWEASKGVVTSLAFIGAFSGAANVVHELKALWDHDPNTVSHLQTLFSHNLPSANHNITDLNQIQEANGYMVQGAVNNDIGIDINSHNVVELINHDGSHVPLSGIDDAGHTYPLRAQDIFDANHQITPSAAKIFQEYGIKHSVASLHVNPDVVGQHINIDNHDIALPTGILSKDGHLYIDRVGADDIDLGAVPDNVSQLTTELGKYGYHAVNHQGVDVLPGFHDVSLSGSGNFPELKLPNGISIESDPSHADMYQLVQDNGHQVIASNVGVGDHGFTNTDDIAEQLQQHGFVPKNGDTFFHSFSSSSEDTTTYIDHIGTQEYIQDHANGHDIFHQHTMYGKTPATGSDIHSSVDMGTNTGDAPAELRLGWGGEHADFSGNNFIDGNGLDANGHIHMVQDITNSYRVGADGSHDTVDLFRSASEGKVGLVISGKGDYFVGEGQNALRDSFFVIPGHVDSNGVVDFDIDPSNPAYHLFVKNADGSMSLLPGFSAQTAVTQGDYTIHDVISSHQDAIPVDIVATSVSSGEVPGEIPVPIEKIVETVHDGMKLGLGAEPTGFSYTGDYPVVDVLVPGRADVMPDPINWFAVPAFAPGEQIERTSIERKGVRVAPPAPVSKPPAPVSKPPAPVSKPPAPVSKPPAPNDPVVGDGEPAPSSDTVEAQSSNPESIVKFENMEGLDFRDKYEMATYNLIKEYPFTEEDIKNIFLKNQQASKEGITKKGKAMYAANIGAAYLYAQNIGLDSSEESIRAVMKSLMEKVGMKDLTDDEIHEILVKGDFKGGSLSQRMTVIIGMLYADFYGNISQKSESETGSQPDQPQPKRLTNSGMQLGEPTEVEAGSQSEVPVEPNEAAEVGSNQPEAEVAEEEVVAEAAEREVLRLQEIEKKLKYYEDLLDKYGASEVQLIKNVVSPLRRRLSMLEKSLKKMPELKKELEKQQNRVNNIQDPSKKANVQKKISVLESNIKSQIDSVEKSYSLLQGLDEELKKALEKVAESGSN